MVKKKQLLLILLLLVGVFLLLQENKNDGVSQEVEEKAFVPEFVAGNFSVTADKTPGYMIYTEKNAGFSFKYPAEAELSEEPGNPKRTIVKREISRYEGYKFEISAIATVLPSREVYFDQFVEKLYSGYKEPVNPDRSTYCSKISPLERTSLSGKLAYTFQAFDCGQWGTDALRGDNTIFLILDEGIVFEAVASAYGKNTRTILDTAEQIALSLSFVD